MRAFRPCTNPSLTLQVNASPSLTADTREDYDLKIGMLDDMLSVVDLEHKLPAGSTPEQVGYS
jgi:tubulin polyglutamylase TTLL9